MKKQAARDDVSDSMRFTLLVDALKRVIARGIRSQVERDSLEAEESSLRPRIVSVAQRVVDEVTDPNLPLAGRTLVRRKYRELLAASPAPIASNGQLDAKIAGHARTLITELQTELDMSNALGETELGID